MNYNYNNHGLDWPSSFPNCSGDYQSPIDLRSPKNSNPFPSYFF